MRFLKLEKPYEIRLNIVEVRGLNPGPLHAIGSRAVH
jgi:hypothetical protein